MYMKLIINHNNKCLYKIILVLFPYRCYHPGIVLTCGDENIYTILNFFPSPILHKSAGCLLPL